MDQHFEILLRFLCPEDREEAGRQYLLLHRKLEGYFRLRGVDDPQAAADETLDRAARRLAEGADVPDINKFCLGIARFIIKESWRSKLRELEAFLKFLSLEHATEADLDRFKLMESCFNEMPSHQRELLQSYCNAPKGRARAKHRHALAESLHLTVTALRIRITRLRQGLDDCVKESSRSQW